MSSHEDRYAVPHFDFHFSFDICLVLYGITGLFKTDQFVLYLVVNHLWWFWCFGFFFFFLSFSTAKISDLFYNSIGKVSAIWHASHLTQLDCSFIQIF